MSPHQGTLSVVGCALHFPPYHRIFAYLGPSAPLPLTSVVENRAQSHIIRASRSGPLQDFAELCEEEAARVFSLLGMSNSPEFPFIAPASQLRWGRSSRGLFGVGNIPSEGFGYFGGWAGCDILVYMLARLGALALRAQEDEW